MTAQRLYALTICAYRKEGMSEDDYHQYLSEHHAQIVKTHLAQAGIVSYTMVGVPGFSSLGRRVLSLLDAQHYGNEKGDETDFWRFSRRQHSRL